MFFLSPQSLVWKFKRFDGGNSYIWNTHPSSWTCRKGVFLIYNPKHIRNTGQWFRRQRNRTSRRVSLLIFINFLSFLTFECFTWNICKAFYNNIICSVCSQRFNAWKLDWKFVPKLFRFQCLKLFKFRKTWRKKSLKVSSKSSFSKWRAMKLIQIVIKPRLHTFS